MASLKYRCLRRFLLLGRYRGPFYKTKSELFKDKHYIKNHRFEAVPPRDFAKKYKVTREFVESYYCYIIERREHSDGEPKKSVLYIHGGGGIIEIIEGHWRFLDEILENADVRLYVPIFPLLTNSTIEKSKKIVFLTYKEMLLRTLSENITVMGDCTGGQLALAILQHAELQKLHAPESLVLIQPLLNVELSERELEYMRKNEANDYYVSEEIIKNCIREYITEGDLSGKSLNPLHGDVPDVGKITVFSGLFSSLHVQAQIFVEKAAAAGVPIQLIELKGLSSGWILLPTKEMRETARAVARIATEQCRADEEISENY